jgi:hypothetical protein
MWLAYPPNVVVDAGLQRVQLYLAGDGPSHDIFSRVFRLLDPAQFHACFLRFMQDFAATAQGVIAIDGKALLSRWFCQRSRH